MPTHYLQRWEEISKFWGELIEFARLRDVWGTSDADIIALRDIITIMCGGIATISYLSVNGCGRMVVTGSEGREYYALRQFFAEVASEAKVIFVSGTLVERSQGYFSDIADREIKSAVFPDINRTNSMMFIHPSTWRFSHWDRKNGIERAIKEARAISESVENQPIYLLAMNARLAKELEKALSDLRNITVDYYRSADSIGVAQDARICIAVGAAELPKNVCDPLAKGKDENELFFDSQQLRINAVDCATWQAISRVKDPEGLVESHVYFLGVRADVVSRIVTWGTDRTVSTCTRKGGIESTVHCEEYLERPNIVMEERSDLRPCRRKTADYVDAIVPISDVIHARQNSYTFPYNDLIGETVRFSDDPLRLYNSPITCEQFKRTYFAVATLFITRIDKCGVQWRHASSKGKFGYITGAPSKHFKDLLEDHLWFADTIAMPPFDSDDNCYYVAVDFDDHDGNTPQSENVKKLTSFLKDRSIPCIAVKSGSNDGYHVFVPLVPTKTLVAYKFLKQLVKDAELDGHKEIERYPKQKSSSSSKGGYGSQVKVPLGFNWKARKQSMVVDPYTLEPVEFVEVTNAVKLRDLPEPPVETKSAKKKSTKESKTSKRTFDSASSQQTEAVYPSGEMRSCIRGVIDSAVQLKGGEGHQMRVAIAAEALRCGLNQEQAIDLFRKQKDFDVQTTRENIRYIWNNNYKRYSCEKLHEQCGSFVKGCEKCPLLEGEF